MHKLNLFDAWFSWFLFCACIGAMLLELSRGGYGWALTMAIFAAANYWVVHEFHKQRKERA
jgi:hypothetical protein